MKSDKAEIRRLKSELKDKTERMYALNRHTINIQSKLNVAMDNLQTVACNASNSDAPKDWAHPQRVQWTAARALEVIAKMDQERKPFV